MKKFVALLFHLIFCFPFILFLALAAKENSDEPRKIIFLIAVGLMLIFGILQPKFYKNDFKNEHWIVIPLVMIGTILTYSLQYFLNLNPILSAGIIGTIAIYLDKKSNINISLPIYCGVFVGMTNPAHQLSFLIIGICGLFAGIIFYLSKNFYNGIGGKLGTIAFASVILLVLILKIIQHDFYI